MTVSIGTGVSTDNLVSAARDPVTGRTEINGDSIAFAAAAGLATAVHPRYFCHLFAGGQGPDDAVVYDRSSAQNNAVLGANLTATQLNAATGYFSTVNPVGGALDSVLHLPSLNLDIAGGECLLIWWLGKVTAEGSDETLMGDSTSTAANGWRIRARSSQKIDLVAYQASGALSSFSGSSTASIADGTLHSFAYFINGNGGTVGKWEDGVNVAAATPFAAGYNTTTAAGVAIGAGTDSPASGIATATRALVMIRWGAADTVPTVAQITEAVKKLRANPGALLTVADLPV